MHLIVMFDVVRCRILFLPPFSVEHVGVPTSRLLALNLVMLLLVGRGTVGSVHGQLAYVLPLAWKEVSQCQLMR